MRLSRMAALGASVIALMVSACSTGGGSASPTSASPTGGGTIASTLILGGPPECPNRPFCLIGLQDTYGLAFKEFKSLDSGGPLTVAALEANEIQVALMFTSDPTIVAKGFVELADDKGLQRADNLVAVVRKEVLDANPDIAELLNGLSARLTQAELNELNRQATEDNREAADIAADWLAFQAADEPNGVTVTVGKTNFYEQDILSELYAQVLEQAGYTVERKEASGTREVVFPALESGEIDILPEYAATALEFVNSGAGQATADAAETAALFNEAAADRGLVMLEPAPAANKNTFVVTPATADQYGLVEISDLAKPLP